MKFIIRYFVNKSTQNLSLTQLKQKAIHSCFFIFFFTHHISRVINLQGFQLNLKLNLSVSFNLSFS